MTLYTTSFPPVKTDTSSPYEIPGPAYDTPPPNIAPGTIAAGCSYYYNVTSADAAASNACTTLATAWGMDPVLFAFYNNDTARPCPQLAASTSVCLMVLNTTAAGEGMGPANKQPGSGPYGCAAWHTIVNGDDCQTIATTFGLTRQQFLSLNPELKASVSCPHVLSRMILANELQQRLYKPRFKRRILCSFSTYRGRADHDDEHSGFHSNADDRSWQLDELHDLLSSPKRRELPYHRSQV